MTNSVFRAFKLGVEHSQNEEERIRLVVMAISWLEDDIAHTLNYMSMSFPPGALEGVSPCSVHAYIRTNVCTLSSDRKKLAYFRRIQGELT